MADWTGNGLLNQPEQASAKPDTSFPGIVWRTLFTALSFTFFGIGALVLSLVVLPPVHLFSRDRSLAQRRSRSAVRGAFRLFIWFMRSTGVLDYQINGSCQIEPGTLIVANHPSLIDVIFSIANLPDTYCVVKEELGRNPLTRLVLLATGYLTSRDPSQMIERCACLLDEGARVILFPEGTRTSPGKAPVFKRGAASLIGQARCPTTPVFLTLHPPTLAKGEPWLKVPRSKVQYSMSIGPSIPASELLEESLSDRQNARLCTRRLQEIFSKQLSNTILENPGVDGIDGKTADRHQTTDRQYS